MGIKIRISFKGGIVGPGIRWVSHIEKSNALESEKLGKGGYNTCFSKESAHEFSNSEEAHEAYLKMMSETDLDLRADGIFFVDENGKEIRVFDGNIFGHQWGKWSQAREAAKRNAINPRDFVV